MSIAYTHRLPYGIFMKKVISDITTYGQLHRIKSKWQHTTRDCSSLVQKGKPLSIEKLVSLFIVLCFGFVLAIFIFIFELGYNSLNKSTDSIQINKKREELILEKVNTVLKEMGEYNNYNVVKTSQVGKALK